MRIRKIVIGLLTCGLITAFAPLEVGAATLKGPGLSRGEGSLVTLVKVQKKKKAKHAHKARRGGKGRGKHARSKGPGRCGAFMYYSMKGHKCMDARKK